MEDPRETLGELFRLIHDHFGDRLVGLYLFGSLATGDFYPGRSDVDLLAVLDAAVAEGADLDALRELHEAFEADRPAWRDRVEVLYLSRDVLATFADAPTGSVARISPGELLHLRDLEGNVGWQLDWHAVLNDGETIFGSEPVTVGPQITGQQVRAAVRSQLEELRDSARENQVAYVPVQQGYIAVTVCRSLYSLATGTQTSKERAVAWVAERQPEDAEYLQSLYRAYRAEVRAPHERLIDFVDKAAREID